MEKSESDEKREISPVAADVAEAESQNLHQPRPWLLKMASWGVELQGITPVAPEDRTDRRFINVFFVWFTMSTNLLPIITGMVGTLAFGLSLRDASLVILFFSLLCALPVGYFSTFGSRTGLRQMLHSRYTFGYYLISIIVALNLCTIAGFGVVDAVLGGSTLAAVSNGKMNATAGIVIVSICGLVVSFGGYRFLHQYERYSWILSLLAIIIATGVGGKHLSSQVAVVESEASAATIVSYGGAIAGFLIPWAALASDFAVYCHPDAGAPRIFWYTYGGLLIPTIPLMILGAAIGGATGNIPAWTDGYHAFSVGGVLDAMLHPAGGFGKFVTVLLALSMIGNLAASMYSISLNFQLLAPFMVRVPRFVFSIVYAAVLIPVAIVAARSFFASLENFLYVIAYWSAAYVAVVTTEHFVFRGADASAYKVSSWDQPSELPTGLAAIAAMGLSFGLIVPCMGQIWYTGPLAETTGDIGFEVALFLAPILYIPFRWLERKVRPI